MRKSRVLKIMREGGVVISTKCNLADPREAEIAARCGFDCVWIDLEHVPNSITSVGEFMRAAKTYDCDLLTRVSRGSYSDMIRPLEADSAGIMVPHVMSLADARKIVYYTKFHPIGRRPIDGGNADAGFGDVNMLDYIKTTNRERFVMIQIEDPEPLAELDEICALPGIDVIFFGPADFSQGIGKPFEFKAPELVEVQRRVAETATRHGKFAGTVGSVEELPYLAELGYSFINIGADVTALYEYYKKNISGARSALAKLNKI